MQIITSIESPCVRNCCLDDSDICLGCFRHLNEITSWSGFDDEQKKQVLTLATQRKNNYKQLIPFTSINGHQ